MVCSYLPRQIMKATFFNITRSICHNCYQIAHSSHLVQIAPSAIFADETLMDNLLDPSMSSVGLFDRRISQSGQGCRRSGGRGSEFKL